MKYRTVSERTGEQIWVAAYGQKSVTFRRGSVLFTVINSGISLASRQGLTFCPCTKRDYRSSSRRTSWLKKKEKKRKDTQAAVRFFEAYSTVQRITEQGTLS